ncbi:hypothetical protein FXO38_22675 [Capsicum annuum]|nr:hypothetical protein FXO38_22675 [Capsicum annuum]KAF3666885.1 hypothetical protein FXO37_10316 [Capsicum annuum]
MDLSQESNNVLPKLSSTHLHHESSSHGSPTNFMVRDMSIQPNSASPPQMGGEAVHHSYSRPIILGLDGHGGADNGIPGQHHQPAQPESPFVPFSQPIHDTLGSNFYTFQWGAPIIPHLEPNIITDQNLTIPDLGKSEEVEFSESPESKQTRHGRILISTQGSKNGDPKSGRASRARIHRASARDSDNPDSTRGGHNAEFKKHCKVMVYIHQPCILALLKTKMSNHQELSEELEFHNHIQSEANDNSGGLVIM